MTKVFIYILLLASISFAQTESEQILKNKSLIAKRYVDSGDYESAKKLYFKLINEQPWNNEHLRSLNDVFLKLKEYDSSIYLLEERIKANPSDPSLYGMLGSTYSTMSNNDKAIEVWKEGININPNTMVTYRIMADYAIKQRSFETAILFLQMGKEKVKDPYIFSYDLANLFSVTMEFENAAKEYSELLISKPPQIGAVKSRMSRYLSHHSAIDLTIKVFEEKYEEGKHHVLLDMLNFLYIRNKNYDKALATTIKLDKSSGGNGINILNFAKSTLAEKQYSASTKAYEYLLDKFGNSSFYPDAKLGYLRAKEEIIKSQISDTTNFWKFYKTIDTSKAHMFDELITEYNDLSENITKRTIVASALFRKAILLDEFYNNKKEAQKVYEYLLEKRIANSIIPSVLEKLGELSIKNNEIDKAKDYYDSLLSIRGIDEKFHSLAKFNLAKIYFWKREVKKSLKKLGEVSANFKDDFANDALEMSFLINTLKKDSVTFEQYSIADLKAEQSNFNEAEKLFMELSNNDKVFFVSDIAKYKYAQVCIAQNKFDQSIKTLEEIINNSMVSPYSDKAYFSIANIYQFGKMDNSKATEYYQKLLDKFPNSLYFDKSRQYLKEINTGQNNNI